MSLIYRRQAQPNQRGNGLSPIVIVAGPDVAHSNNCHPETEGLYKPLVCELCAGSGALKFVCLLYSLFLNRIFLDLFVIQFSLLLAVYRNVTQITGELCATTSNTFCHCSLKA